MISNIVTVKKVDIIQSETGERKKIMYVDYTNNKQYVKNVFKSTDGYDLLEENKNFRIHVQKKDRYWEVVKIEFENAVNDSSKDFYPNNEYYSRIELNGRLGCDPVFNVVGANKSSVCNFTVYVNDDRYEVKAWDKLAKDCNQWKHTGSHVKVIGYLKIKQYIDSENNNKTELQVTAKEVLFL